jgi:hypothetical protein
MKAITYKYLYHGVIKEPQSGVKGIHGLISIDIPRSIHFSKILPFIVPCIQHNQSRAKRKLEHTRYLCDDYYKVTAYWYKLFAIRKPSPY